MLSVLSPHGWHPGCYSQLRMVPISRRKQLAGVVGAVALGYTLSWVLTPAPTSGPIDNFGSTFGRSVAPVVVPPVGPRGDRSMDTAQPLNSSPKALQRDAYEPI
jgi:hypothetical protein